MHEASAWGKASGGRSLRCIGFGNSGVGYQAVHLGTPAASRSRCGRGAGARQGGLRASGAIIGTREASTRAENTSGRVVVRL